jgi:tetratricopeptide (TPR) repeat protein
MSSVDRTKPEITERKQFLLNVFDKIAESNGDREVIYSLFTANQDLLDERAIEVLQNLVEELLSNATTKQQKSLCYRLGTFCNLLIVYPLGNRSINLELAIVGYRAALEVFTRQDAPLHWATIKNNLASAYSDRIKGDRAENIELAIAGYRTALEVFTRQDAPLDWALTQNNLANAYVDRIRGDRAENIELAITGCRAALEVFTHLDVPLYWATTQYNLANAYSERIKGDRSENIELAIVHNEHAQTIFTQTIDPDKWARVQVLFGKIFTELAEQKVDLSHNITAERYYQSALTVFTQTDYPREWASIQLELAQLSIKHQQNYEIATNYLIAASEHLLAQKSDNSLFELAQCLHHSGYLGQAKIHFKDCIRLYQRLDSQTQVAAATAALGNIEMQMGQLDAARNHLQTALEFYQSQDRLDRVESINYLLQHLATPALVL